jgi:hypothetical protein
MAVITAKLAYLPLAAMLFGVIPFACSGTPEAKMGLGSYDGDEEVRDFSKMAESWVAGTSVMDIKSGIQRFLREHPHVQCPYSGRWHLGGSGNGEFVVLLSRDLQISCPVDLNDLMVEPARVEKRRPWTVWPDGTWTPARQ